MAPSVTVEVTPSSLDLDGLFDASFKPVNFPIKDFNVIPIHLVGSGFQVFSDWGGCPAMFVQSGPEGSGTLPGIFRWAVRAFDVVYNTSFIL